MHLDMHSPTARVLGLFAAVNSRWHIGRGWFTRIVSGWIKRLPLFSRYLK
jgi:hypothetical protein